MVCYTIDNQNNGQGPFWHRTECSWHRINLTWKGMEPTSVPLMDPHNWGCLFMNISFLPLGPRRSWPQALPALKPCVHMGTTRCSAQLELWPVLDNQKILLHIHNWISVLSQKQNKTNQDRKSGNTWCVLPHNSKSLAQTRFLSPLYFLLHDILLVPLQPHHSFTHAACPT